MRVQFFMMGASIFPEAMHVPFLKIFNHFSIITLPLLTTKGSLSFVFIPYWKPNVLKLNNHWFIFFFLIISRENCNFRSEFAINVIYLISHQFSLVQSLICVWLFVTPWIAACQASLSIINSQSLPKLMSIESLMPSSHLIICRPLLLLPPIPPSIRVFSNESTLRMSWPKYWSFSFSISPSNEHPGFISFRMDWLDLLAVQGMLKSLLQYHSSKAPTLWCSAFFTVQLSHPYMTTEKP